MMRVLFCLLFVFSVGHFMEFNGPQAQADSGQSFLPIYQVAMHDRCIRCHSVSDFANKKLYKWSHPMQIDSRISTVGYNCQSCHQSKQWKSPGMPPGAMNWHAPPAFMAMRTTQTAKEICEQWKNILSPSGILDHVSKDPLIAWAWEPGPGREKPPGANVQSFILDVRNWVNKGAVCPND